MTFRFRVRGVQQRRPGSSRTYTFDETYDLPGEHPAEALGQLLQEIEWGILDADRGFTVTFVPAEDPA